MDYSIHCDDAYAELFTLREVLSAATIEIQSARSEEGVLTISTDQDIPEELISELGLS